MKTMFCVRVNTQLVNMDPQKDTIEGQLRTNYYGKRVGNT